MGVLLAPRCTHVSAATCIAAGFAPPQFPTATDAVKEKGVYCTDCYLERGKWVSSIDLPPPPSLIKTPFLGFKRTLNLRNICVPVNALSLL